jgi:ABC-2 type transport system ATP-binding protein/lipopolysaccharide transport system ATP-binding protein
VDRVQFERVSKKYVLGSRTNAREALVAAARRVARRDRDPARELWSLRDVSFTVADGDALGIVGRNGAGKSTILKILTGITVPTAGVSRTRGRVAALLEVGTGFHPELTGRENIFLNGAILGMSRRDIVRAFDAIVDFSGVERFLDTPVKRYSSGMYLRLAFAVAAHLEPDILVVDEILAVGDAEFQRKCLGRMEEAEQEGRTVLFVSHDLDTLTRLCRRAMWMEAGEVRCAGPSDEIVRDYLASGLVAERSGTSLIRSGPVAVHGVRVVPAEGEGPGLLMRGDSLRVEVEFELADEVPGMDLAIFVTTRTGVRVLDEVFSDRTEQRLGAGRYKAAMEVPPVLNVGDFSVGLWFGTAHTDILEEPVAASFTLHGSDRGRPDRVLVGDLPILVEQLQSVDGDS